MKLFGHRGASADFPENTLEAFEGAVVQGADGVELDVMRCGSGELVVCHDESLERLAGQGLRVGETPLWKLKRCDVGSRLGFSPATIPELGEVFELLPAEFEVNIELKCDTLDDRGLAVEVAKFLNADHSAERVIVSSFNPACLLRFADRAPGVRRGQLLDPDRPRFRQESLWTRLTSNYSIHPPNVWCDEASVARWKAAGLAIATWTVDDAVEARRLESLGVDVVMTNKPGALRRALKIQPDR